MQSDSKVCGDSGKGDSGKGDSGGKARQQLLATGLFGKHTSPEEANAMQELYGATNGVGKENGYCHNELATEASVTADEHEWLECYKNGGSIKAVADHYGVSKRAAKRKLCVIRNKIGASDLRELRGAAVTGGSTGITAKKLLALLASQGYRCALSGQELTPTTATLDHKQAVSEGGNHEIDNVWFLHCDVNRAKGTMNVDDFIRMSHRVAQWQG